jgi:hypothetical protein
VPSCDCPGKSGRAQWLRRYGSKDSLYEPGNFSRVFEELGKTIDLLELNDNSAFEMPPKLIASFLGREVTFLASELPAWMDEALGQTAYSTVKLREFFEQGESLPVAG